MRSQATDANISGHRSDAIGAETPSFGCDPLQDR